MHDLVRLYLTALRDGDGPLATRLARALRTDRELAGAADRSLTRAARGPARWSAAAERVVRRILGRLT